MIICIRSSNVKISEWSFHNYIDDHRNEIKEVKRFPSRLVMKNGDEIFFMPDSEYWKWCKGKTYMMNGEMYHSGFIISEIFNYE